MIREKDPRLEKTGMKYIYQLYRRIIEEEAYRLEKEIVLKDITKCKYLLNY